MADYKVTCKICGKLYISHSAQAKFCSTVCRNAAIKQQRNPDGRKCKTCGKPLNDCRQTWCINCLFEAYERDHSPLAYKRLANRGYDKKMIKEELKNRRK